MLCQYYEFKCEEKHIWKEDGSNGETLRGSFRYKIEKLLQIIAMEIDFPLTICRATRGCMKSVIRLEDQFDAHTNIP